MFDITAVNRPSILIHPATIRIQESQVKPLQRTSFSLMHANPHIVSSFGSVVSMVERQARATLEEIGEVRTALAAALRRKVEQQ